jgi:hypothetical protein
VLIWSGIDRAFQCGEFGAGCRHPAFTPMAISPASAKSADRYWRRG